MLSTDHDFTTFLASRDLRRLALEKPVPDFRTVRTREYDAATVRALGVLHPAPIVAPEPTPAPVVVVSKPRGKQFVFTEAQMAIAIAVQKKQLQKAGN